MMTRPIFRPMKFFRADCRMTASLTGNTVPAKSRAILNFGHSVIVSRLESLGPMVSENHGDRSVKLTE